MNVPSRPPPLVTVIAESTANLSMLKVGKYNQSIKIKTRSVRRSRSRCPRTPRRGSWTPTLGRLAPVPRDLCDPSGPSLFTNYVSIHCGRERLDVRRLRSLRADWSEGEGEGEGAWPRRNNAFQATYTRQGMFSVAASLTSSSRASDGVSRSGKRRGHGGQDGERPPEDGALCFSLEASPCR